MLIAEGSAAIPAARPPDQLMRRAAATSAVLHAVLLASLLMSWRWASLPQAVPPIEIEMIQSAALTQGDAPAQPQPPPPQEGTGPAAAPPPPPAVHIGNATEQSDPLVVTGDNIVPPAPDSRYRNQPPPYPPDAARIGAEGTVQLTIHVSAQGIPMVVQVRESSGNQSLDDAARRAVQHWRFRPALAEGRPIDFEYFLNIHFAIGDHP